MNLKKDKLPIFRKTLLNWYHKHKRPLPFRKTKNPYKIWLSEIMLQQTTMTTVLDYYKRFLKHYPNVKAVAQANPEDLLNLWQGLGYYSRIRNFQFACQQVMNEHGGKVPQSYSELTKLKGIGDYTAAAIASICFHQNHAVVDGNVKRVLSRIYWYTKEINTTQAKKFFNSKAEQILDPKHAGDFNQAMMELGAMVCTPKPNCLICPVNKFCAAFGRNPEKLPIKKKQSFIQVDYAALVLHTKSQILLKEPHAKNLISNMWELPSFYNTKIIDPIKTWQRLFNEQLNLNTISKIGQVKHSITNKKIATHVYDHPCQSSQLTKLTGDGFKVIRKKDLMNIPVNTLSRKILKKFFGLSLCLLLVIATLAHGATDKRYKKSFKNKKDKNEDLVRSEIGLNIPKWGIAIDATFNAQLDDVVPGYHIVNIVLTNRRSEPIELRPELDKWIIVDNLGKKHTAYNHVKQFNKSIWPKMPRRLQKLLDYPQRVSSGKSTTIDVFLPKSVDLFNFREVIWKSSHFKKEFNIFTAYEKDLSIPKNDNEFTVPKDSITEEELLLKEKQLLEQQEKDKNVKVEIITPNDTHPTIDDIVNTGRTPNPTNDGFIRVK